MKGTSSMAVLTMLTLSFLLAGCQQVLGILGGGSSTVAVNGVSLDSTSLNLGLGASASLAATVVASRSLFQSILAFLSSEL